MAHWHVLHGHLKIVFSKYIFFLWSSLNISYPCVELPFYLILFWVVLAFVQEGVCRPTGETCDSKFVSSGLEEQKKVAFAFHIFCSLSRCVAFTHIFRHNPNMLENKTHTHTMHSFCLIPPSQKTIRKVTVGKTHWENLSLQQYPLLWNIFWDFPHIFQVLILPSGHFAFHPHIDKCHRQ